MIAFRLAAACCLGLEMLGHSFHPALPLAGSHLAQLGLVFGLTFILCEFREPIAAAIVKLTRRRRRRTPKQPPPGE
jgi:hypothetical protein